MLYNISGDKKFKRQEGMKFWERRGSEASSSKIKSALSVKL